MKPTTLILCALLAASSFAAPNRTSVNWSHSGQMFAVAGSAPPPVASRLVQVKSPTPKFPRSWTLPAGWNVARRKLKDDSHVEYYSGLDSSISARIYSWPAVRSQDHLSAQSKLLDALGKKVMVNTLVQKRRELLLTLWGWDDPSTINHEATNPEQLKPDTFMRARVTRIRDRLVAAVVSVPRPEEGLNEAMQRAQDLIDRLRWTPPRRIAWGQR